MFAVRPVQAKDLSHLERFAHGTRFGMLGLPRNQELLQKKIHQSLSSFAKEVAYPKEELYFFVLENTQTGDVVGCSAIMSKTGTDKAMYAYCLERLQQKASDLPLPPVIELLRPLKESSGPAELGSLYLEQAWRKGHLGTLLARSRYLFIFQNKHRFNSRIVARIRGMVDEKTNTSPFWEGLGKHFLHMELFKTQQLLQQGEELEPYFMPEYPIYVSLLPKKTQQAIRKPHPSAVPAAKMLEKEGFFLTNEIDIFDGGPVYSCLIDQIHTIKSCRLTQIVEITAADEQDSEQFLASNCKDAFRAAIARVNLSSAGQAIISQETAACLQVSAADTICLAPLSQHPHPPSQST